MSEINIFEPYIAKDFDVYFQKDAALETKVDVRYLKYGEDEIENYVNQVAKPEIDEYVARETSRLITYHIDLDDNILSLEGTDVATSTVDLNNFPFSEKCVTLADDQSIDAVKTFVQNPVISKNEAPALTVQNTSVLFGSAPSENQVSSINFTDSAGTILGAAQHKVCADASVVSNLSCSNLEATDSAEIAIGYDENGEVYTSAPTPVSSDNSTQIATTAFVKNQNYAKNDLSNLVATTSKNFDAQWVSSQLQLANYVTLPTLAVDEYDISNYLPDDNYKYEVIVVGSVETGSNSGDSSQLTVYSDILPNYGLWLCRAITRGSFTNVARGTGVLPVGQGRIIQVHADANNTGKYNLNLRGYRRIGTNS